MQQNKINSCFIGGPCAKKSNLWEYGKISKTEYDKYITDIAKTLAEDCNNIEIIPDEGVPLDIAKKTRLLVNRPNVIGYFPKHGMSFHLEKNYQYCDEIIGVDGGWTSLNTVPSSFSKIFICFGLSPGVFQEIAHTKIHRIWNKIDVKILMDERAISSRLPPELATEINLTYFDSNDELNSILKALAFEQYSR